MSNVIHTSIEPWLSVSNGIKAINFYKSSFDATEVYHMEDPGGGIVSKLSVDGAVFWLSAEGNNEETPVTKTTSPIRMILMVHNPDARFAQALKAGASQIYPVSEGHGWRLGRLVDPFGHHWEIGHPIE